MYDQIIPTLTRYNGCKLSAAKVFYASQKEGMIMENLKTLSFGTKDKSKGTYQKY
jgi:hypothetical protein